MTSQGSKQMLVLVRSPSVYLETLALSIAERTSNKTIKPFNNKRNKK